MSPARSGRQPKRYTILVVDDNAATRLAIEAALPGFHIVNAASGEEALRALLRTHVDLILLDVRMPGMDGLETATMIRERAQTAQLPIIFMSAIDKTDEAVFEGYRAGGIDYVFKPFSPAVLRAKVAVFIELLEKTTSLTEEVRQRQQTEESLRKSEASLRRAQEIAKLGSWEWDLVSDDFVWSVEQCRIWGVDPLSFEPTYEKALARICPEDRDRVDREIKQAINDTGSLDTEFRLGEPEARGPVIRLQAKVAYEAGEPVLVTGTAQDITERRRTEEDLLRVQKLESIALLAGGIAHDFNNALSGIMMSIYLAKQSVPDEGVAYEMLCNAEKASLKARGLSQQLLTFSKGGAPILRKLSLGKLLRDSIRLALAGSSMVCECTVADDVWAVEADEGQLHQAIGNIIINSEQAGSSRLRVAVRNLDPQERSPRLDREEGVVISIQDNGCGVAEGDLLRVFDPYFTTKASGTGLGLATTHSIIRRHGGHVTLQSRVGEGTTVTIYLPAAPDGGQMEEDEPRLLVGRQTAGKVLIMDDEAGIRQPLGATLKLLGYEVGYAADGAEAIDRYRREMELGAPFDAVIVDLTIPGGMGGEEAIRELLRLDPTATAIVSSGYSDSPIMAHHAEYGFKAAVAKPYLVEDLVRELRRLIP